MESDERDRDRIEEAPRSQLSKDLFAEIWEKATLDPDEAMELALEAQREAREELRRAR